MTYTLQNEGQVVLNVPSVEMLIFSLNFDQSYPFIQMTQKVWRIENEAPFNFRSGPLKIEIIYSDNLSLLGDAEMSRVLAS